MKTKETYNKPEIEIIEVLTEGVIAASVGVGDETTDDAARSKKKFWDDDKY